MMLVQTDCRGADGLDGNRIFVERHGPELDGSYPAGQLQHQFLPGLRQHHQRIHSLGE